MHHSNELIIALTSDPGFKRSVSSVLLTTPLSGNPLAIPYDISSINRYRYVSLLTNLSNNHHVRFDPAIFRSKVFSGPSEAALDLVKDEEDSMFVRNFTKAPEE